MSNLLSNKFFLLAVLIPLASAQDFFPLAPGNSWTYTNFSGSESHTISVGLPFLINGKVYYSVTGYGADKLLIRRQENGDLVAYDEEENRELQVARFDPNLPPILTRLGGCSQHAEARPKRVPFQGLAGRDGTALEVNYLSRSCADIGLDSEYYMENIGLVRRTLTTFAGPKLLTLVSARVGRLSFEFAPNTAVRLLLETSRLRLPAPPAATLPFTATLRISSFDTLPVKATFPSSQQYDLILRNANGEVAYKWSADKLFLPVVTTIEIANERAFKINADFPPYVPPGDYTVEAWLTTTHGNQFAASAGVRIVPHDAFEFPPIIQ